MSVSEFQERPTATPPSEPGMGAAEGAAGSTRTRILDIAELLVQTRGFNGFSYANVASELGITTASLHYHFPGKSRLGAALVERWTERHFAALAAIEENYAAAYARLVAYADLYDDMSRGSRLGLCGMLAAEHQTLPPPMSGLVAAFLTANLDWLEGILESGRSDGSLTFDGSVTDAALVILAGIQGAVLIARPHQDAGLVRTISRRLLESVVLAP